MDDDDHEVYHLGVPFWVDTDGYTGRDRFIFTCGFEFATFHERARDCPGPFRMTIHRENESRIRMACGRLGRACSITACDWLIDPGRLWSVVDVGGEGDHA